MSERKWTLTATEYTRLRDWIADPNRKPANLAFTAGPARQLAYAAESALSDVVVMSRAEAEAMEEIAEVASKLCDKSHADQPWLYQCLRDGLAALDAARKGGG